MNFITSLFVSVLFGISTPTLPPAPGVVFEIETTDHQKVSSEAISMMVEGPNLKMTISPSDQNTKGGEMIFHGDRGENGEMVIIDHEKKEYMVMDDAMLKMMGGAMDAMQKQMEELMKNMTEEQKAAMLNAQANMPGQAPPAAPKVEDETKITGEKGMKNGYPCVKYDVFREGKKIKEVWTTDFVNVEGGAETQDALKKFQKFMEAMQDQILKGPGAPQKKDEPFSAMNFENGFPVIVNDFNEGGELESESNLISAKRRSLDPSEFEPPAGYKLRSMMGPGK